MYNKIKKQKTTLALYTERLVRDGLIPEGEIEDMKAAFQAFLNDEFEAGKDYKNPTRPIGWMGVLVAFWTATKKIISAAKPQSAPITLKEVGRALSNRARRLPKSIKPLRVCWKAKQQMFETGEDLTGQPPKRWHLVHLLSKAHQFV